MRVATQADGIPIVFYDEPPIHVAPRFDPITRGSEHAPVELAGEELTKLIRDPCAEHMMDENKTHTVVERMQIVVMGVSFEIFPIQIVVRMHTRADLGEAASVGFDLGKKLAFVENRLCQDQHVKLPASGPIHGVVFGDALVF